MKMAVEKVLHFAVRLRLIVVPTAIRFNRINFGA